MEAAPCSIAVLGAGVVGLAAGIRLLRECPNVSVTVFADLTGSETTSQGSGGLWMPYTLGDTPGDLALRWSSETFSYLLQLFNSSAGAAAGAQLVSGYHLWQHQEPDPFWKDVAPSFRHLTARELASFSNPAWIHGWKWTTIIVDMPMYMTFLLEAFLQAGGKLRRQKVTSLTDFAKFDMVINCGGLRGGLLFGDDKVIPVRGQVIRVSAPWVKHFYFAGLKSYILPNVDTVVLGGTTQKNSWDTTVSQEDKEVILNNVCKLVPSLKHAKSVRDWVGLRPYREPVRLQLDHHEVELPNGASKQLAVVHNYGHGGSGVTLHWGCAADVVGLVQQHMGNSSMASKTRCLPQAKL
ncbi:hypothetical protein ABBQ38_011974 [Trebouxia sp. C0009 RCD-2024]